MKYEIPRYSNRQLDQKITLCVSREQKVLWDKYTRNEKIRIPKMLRDSLDEILAQIGAQIDAGEAGGNWTLILPCVRKQEHSSVELPPLFYSI